MDWSESGLGGGSSGREGLNGWNSSMDYLGQRVIWRSVKGTGEGEELNGVFNRATVPVQNPMSRSKIFNQINTVVQSVSNTI